MFENINMKLHIPSDCIQTYTFQQKQLSARNYAVVVSGCKG